MDKGQFTIDNAGAEFNARWCRSIKANSTFAKASAFVEDYGEQDGGQASHAVLGTDCGCPAAVQVDADGSSQDGSIKADQGKSNLHNAIENG